MEIIEQRLGMTPGNADRTPWLLLHGAYRDASAWEHVQADCDERGIASRAISLPGHGTSTMHKGELQFYSIRDYVRIMLSELEHATPKPILIGHGLGAWLALRAAEECELPGVVLIGPPPLGGMLGRALKTFARHPLWVIANVASGFESPWLGSEAIAKYMLGDTPNGSESRCVLRELLHAPVAFPAQVTTPVLVLSSEQDKLVSARRHEQLARSLPAATHGSIPGAPHDVYGLDWAGQLTESIASWCASLATSSSTLQTE